MLRSLFAFLDTLSDLIADRTRELLAEVTAPPRRRGSAPPLLPPLGAAGASAGAEASGAEASSPPDA
jgi:hypothetical protein